MATISIRPISMRHAKLKEAIVLAICLACIFLFLTSAYGKVTEHQRFVRGLSKVSFIGSGASFLGWLVPLAEILVAILLMIPKTCRFGLQVFTAFMAIFTLYIGGMMLWADKLPCHCNLFIEKLSWGQHLFFNTGFIALGILALGLSKKP